MSFWINYCVDDFVMVEELLVLIDVYNNFNLTAYNYVLYRPEVRLFLNLDKNMPAPDDEDVTTNTDENSNLRAVSYLPPFSIDLIAALYLP